MKRRILLFTIFLFAFATATAQTLPRWPQGTSVKVFLFRGAFTANERNRIETAIDSWRPFLPEGITMQIAGEADSVQQCQGCVTFNLSPTAKEVWGECESHRGPDGRTWFAIIRIDRRAGSGDNFQRVVEHEIGHSLGLDHRSHSIMAACAVGAPSAQDAALLRAMYPDAKAATSIPTPVATLAPALPALPALDVTKTAEQETAMLAVLQRYSFRREVSIQTLDNEGKVTGDYERISQMVLADDGRRIERVVSHHSHLKGLRITGQDRVDFSGAQMGVIGDFARYRFSRSPSGAIEVKPLSIDRERVFKGEIQLDDAGRIVKLEGTTLPEKDERFPVFTSIRKEVSGYLFPAETFGEGVLQFPRLAVRVRWRVKFTDYKEFRSRVSIAEVSQ
jgi:hypothetical protein